MLFYYLHLSSLLDYNMLLRLEGQIVLRVSKGIPVAGRCHSNATNPFVHVATHARHSHLQWDDKEPGELDVAESECVILMTVDE